jgi:hypothetical protein
VGVLRAGRGSNLKDTRRLRERSKLELSRLCGEAVNAWFRRGMGTFPKNPKNLRFPMSAATLHPATTATSYHNVI